SLLLGRGGMGIVYKARQKRLKRLVALKMLLGGAHADPEQLVRFCQETETLACLKNPNIVKIFEVGKSRGCPYYAMEFIDGKRLADRIAGQPQPPSWAASLVETLARAIHEAHQQGIIHRDLKPANVLLTKEEVPKITD